MGTSKSTGTVIVGQRALFREGVAALLRHTPYKVVATAQRPSELKDVRASAGSRMLVILGINESSGSATEATENIKALRSLFPASRIVVIAENHGPTNFQHIMMAAPDGYVANLTSRDVLLRMLEVALLDQQVIVLSRPPAPPVDADDSATRANGGHSTPPNGRQCLSGRAITKDPQLSQREREVLIRLAEGDSNKQIARLCNITESTVKVHLKAILRKITVHNRTQAAIWAIAEGYHIMPESSNQTAASDRSSIERQAPEGNGKYLAITASAKCCKP